MTRLRVGVIGLGVGEQHIDGYRRANDAEVIALCDIDPGKRAMAGEKYPGCRVFADAGEMIEKAGLDVLSIASFDHYHADQVVRALDSGMHVFCEKPLCRTESELAAIASALRRNSTRRLTTNTVLRMSPRFIGLRRAIRDGQLGRLYYMDADYNYGRLDKLKDGWRGRIKDYSVMLGGGIHMVDLLLWLSGQTVVEVMAMGNKLCSEGSHFETPDMVAALLQFDDGLVAKVSANFGCVYPHFHKLSVYGTKATFENDSPSGRLFRSREGLHETVPVDTAYPGVRKGDLIPGFIDAIRGIGRAEIDEQATMNTVHVCLAIDRSWKERRPVRIETNGN